VNLLIGAATIGLILAPLALGVFISYRIYKTLDLTTDGSHGLGAAVVAALLVRQINPLIATLIGLVAGIIAGGITGVLHTRFRVSTLLAGVLTTTALYSVNLFVMGSGNVNLASADTLFTRAENLGRQLLGIPESLSIMGTTVGGGSFSALFMTAVLAAALAVGLTLFLATDLGLALRAAGNNPAMAKALGIDVERMVVVGLGISNGLIALSGALFAQYSGFANIQMGIGAIVTGVATLMVGETLFGKRPLGRWIAGAVGGAVVFRLVVAGAVRAGLNPDALKLVTAIFVLAVLIVPGMMSRARARKTERAAHHA
jgi:putative tryptophan/tyrosine transport system permease protein